MRQTPFYLTLNELEHPSIGDRTPTSYFWLRTIELRNLNLIGPSLEIMFQSF